MCRSERPTSPDGNSFVQLGVKGEGRLVFRCWEGGRGIEIGEGEEVGGGGDGGG